MARRKKQAAVAEAAKPAGFFPDAETKEPEASAPRADDHDAVAGDAKETKQSKAPAQAGAKPAKSMSRIAAKDRKFQSLT
jgi:hypothetical protein